MNPQAAAIEKICFAPNRLAAYIDGELQPREELDLELHLTLCERCHRELNAQKEFLQTLNFALDAEKSLPMPADFAKVVVANAESRVCGLRRPQERFRALFVCAALFLPVLLGLGGETKTVFAAFAKFAEQFLAVSGFVWNLIYDIAFGTAVILRSISHQLAFNSAVASGLICLLCVVLLVVFSRLAARIIRS